MNRILLAAAALAAGVGAAAAADLPYKAPPPPPRVASWTGCYIGAGGGYGLWNQDHTTLDAAGTAAAPRTTTGGRGWFGTVQGGCDYQFFDRWLVGAFGDYDFSGIRGDFADSAFGLYGREKMTSSWAAGGRVGYLLYPQVLAFASGGYTEAHFSQINLGTAAGAFTNIYPSHTYSGWFLGTGYEYRLAWILPGLTWNTEYRFSQFDNDRLPLLNAAGATGFAMDSRKYEQSIRSELVWRFDGWWH